MGALVAGQNVEWGSRSVEFRAPAGVDGVAALAVNEQGRADAPERLIVTGRPIGGGIALRDNVIHVDLDVVDDAVQRVLCIAYTGGPRPGAFDCAIGDVTFAVSDPFPATVCFEVYRRGPTWKLRAVGQGYAGGLPELLAAHGLTGSAIPTAAAPPAVEPDQPPQPSPGPTVEPLQRIWMIYEDAARISAAFLSAREYATSRLDDELSAAIADPATRNTPAATAASNSAHQRHDELIARARADYDRDSTYLVNELREVDDTLPPSMASWKSPAWRRRPEAGDAVRIGSLSNAELGPLSIPFCVPAPLRRPMWIETVESSAAVPVLTALVLRLLAASPHPAPTLDVIDLAGGLHALSHPLAHRMVRPVVSDSADIAPRLKELVDAADLAEMRLGVDGQRSPASVVVFADFGFGLPPEALGDVIALAAKSGLGSSLLIVGENNWDGTDSRMRELSEYSQHIVITDGVMLDPWTRNPWTFVPDTAPEPGRTVSDLLAGMSALQPFE
ncbi:TerD family protein [Mycolicibacterium arenosum]|uniref:TerD family protein n=1 Tax=Mycolicibacterium arenosum TaxID=2952157 RepID=A0ABT1M8I2_9MYCO|nr:TerD family protein [Mycolicibacterium sp. CAU 1645]MCP9274107.1 TerD family protein [Mycolicibacterium sp. CAU 1645]